MKLTEYKNPKFIDTTEEEEYKETINKLKSEFRKKLQDRLFDVNLDMKKDYIKILGDEFSTLAVDHENAVNRFREAENDLLHFAMTSCGAREDIVALSEWIKNRKDDDKEDEKKGRELFKVIVDKVDAINPELVLSAKRVKKDIIKIMNKLNELLSAHKKEIDEIDKKYREILQDDIVNFVIEYVNKSDKINTAFGIDTKNKGGEKRTPFGDDYKIPELKFEFDDEDRLIFPFDGEKGILN